MCLAITPAMKAQGIKNRCRLSEIPRNVKYEVAPPRMALYIEYAADIYSMYLDYFDPQDIHVYSIDESFIDATAYLGNGRNKVSFAKFLMNEIANRYHIPSTAGIGTNLYLAKIALDITAKHARDHIGILDEETYRQTLWDHRPITDFWMVANGTARRLERYGVFDMRGVTQMDTGLMYKIFGKNAELLIDHAWGREPCLISDIKGYKSKSKSVSFSQILPRDYSFAEARTVMQEMALNGAADLMKRKVITSRVSIFVGYTHDEIAPTKGGTKLDVTTALASFLVEATLRLYDKTTDRNTKIRRLGIAFENVCDEGCEGYILAWAVKGCLLWQQEGIQDPPSVKKATAEYRTEMDDIQAPPVGTEGTVFGVDDIGSIMVHWDNGNTLSVAYGEDLCRRIDEEGDQ